jgi:hypothetical protein
MKTTLYIKRLSDGVIRESKWQGDSRFWWEEGNAACDCNRALAFGDIDEIPCSDHLYNLVNEDGTPFDGWDDDDE